MTTISKDTKVDSIKQDGNNKISLEPESKH